MQRSQIPTSHTHAADPIPGRLPNPHAGEVTLEINGCPHILRLSLGALAALEARLQVGSLIALVARFESGGFSASDVLALLAAGLQGAGHSLTEAELAQAQIGGGPLRAAQVAAQLLALSFGSADPASAADAVSTVADQK